MFRRRAHGRGDGVFDRCRIGDGRQGNPVDAVDELLRDVGGELQREQRLAGPAGPGEGDETGVRPEERETGAEVGATPDKRNRLRRQIGGGEGARRRELRRQTLDLELVEALRSREILEPELSEIACGSGQQLLRRRRQKHLTAVRRRADPGRLVNVEPEVHVLHQQGLPGVESHPAAHRFRLRPRMTGERALALGRGRRAGVRLCEGDEEGVALAGRPRPRRDARTRRAAGRCGR